MLNLSGQAGREGPRDTLLQEDTAGPMTESPFRALSYAAVSSEAQASDDKGSIEAQLEANHGVSESHDWPIVAEVVIRGHSRSYFRLDEIVGDSPEYRELVRLIRSRTINLILCWR